MDMLKETACSNQDDLMLANALCRNLNGLTVRCTEKWRETFDAFMKGEVKAFFTKTKVVTGTLNPWTAILKFLGIQITQLPENVIKTTNFGGILKGNLLDDKYASKDLSLETGISSIQFSMDMSEGQNKRQEIGGDVSQK